MNTLSSSSSSSSFSSTDTAGPSSSSTPIGIVALELQAALDEISVPPRIYENKAIRNYLYALRALLLAIPSRDVSAVVHKNIHPGLPLRNLATASSYLHFLPPSTIDIVGSYRYRTLVQPTLSIDMVVEIPHECIHSRDHKNYIYTDKRNMYLGVLADALQGSEGNINTIISKVQVSTWYNDPTKTILVITPNTTTSSNHGISASSTNLPKNLVIRIIPTLSGNVFSPKQLRPQWNNVRAWIFTKHRPDDEPNHTKINSQASTTTLPPGTPTPVYNTLIAEDCGLLTMHCTTYAAFMAVPAAVPATIAAKAWARRRGWHRYQDHLYPSLLTLIMVYLIQTNRILKIMNPLQCLRVLFTFLATNDFKTNPIVIKPIDTSLIQKFNYFSSNSSSSNGSNNNGNNTGISIGNGDNDSYDDNDQLDSDDEGMDDASSNDDDHDSDEGNRPSSSSFVYGRLASVTNTVLQEYQQHFPAVLIGPDGITNYMARLTVDTLYEIKQEAQLASIAFAANTSNANSNSNLHTPIDHGSLLERIMGDTLYPGLRYDRILVAPIPPNPLLVQQQQHASANVTAQTTKISASTKAKTSTAASSSTASSNVILSEKVENMYCNYPSWSHIVTRSATHVLRPALTDRVNLLRVHPVYASSTSSSSSPSSSTVQRWPCPDPFTWSLQSSPPSPSCLWICIQINPEAGGSIANRIIDKVPSEDKILSQKFLDLWGELPNGLAELRRFADGAVQYAVIWDATKLGGRNYTKHIIIPLIVSHTLMRHLGITMPVSMLHAGDALSFILDKPVANATSSLSSSSSSEDGGAVKGLVLADVARVCPSLALERILDTGGSTSTVTRIQVSSDIHVASAPITKSTEYSPLTGFSLTKRSMVQVSTASIPPLTPTPSPTTVSDPLSRGPTLAVIHAIHTLDWLSTALRSLKNMPISVASVAPIAPELRYTSIFTPAPHPLATTSSTGHSSTGSSNIHDSNDALSGLLGGNRSANFEVLTAQTLVQAAMASYESYTNLLALSASTSLPHAPVSSLQETYDDRPESGIEGPTVCQTITPLEIIIRLESSNKWPDDPTAIAALKTAFYLKIQYGLNSLYNSNVYARAHPDWLDILVGGYAFRAYLHVDREITVLQSIARRLPLAKVHTKKGITSDASMDIVVHPGAPSRNAEADDNDEENASDNGDDDQQRTRKVRGFVNIGPVGFTRAEAAPRKKARQEVSARTGFDVTTPVSKEALLGALHDVFGKHTTAPNANASITATAAGNRLDALYLRGIARPTHASSIHALTQRFIAFGPACRLALFWLRQQRLGGEGNSLMHTSAIESPDTCLLNHGEILSSSTSTPIAQEAVELIMAYIFASPAPFTVPGTPTVAFLRFLRILGHHDWLREPLLVDLESCIHQENNSTTNNPSLSSSSNGVNVINNEGMIQTNDYRTLLARFRETRQQSTVPPNSTASNYIAYPPVDDHQPNGAAMYIVTPRERGTWKPVWTRYSPSWSILQTLVQNARTTESKLVSSLLPVIPHSSSDSTNDTIVNHPSVYFGTAEGTCIETLYRTSTTEIPLLSSTYDNGGSVEKYDVVVQTKGLSLLPRVSLDGRNYGPIKDPYECAAYLVQPPSILVEKVQQTLQLYRPLAQDKSKNTSSNSTKDDSKVTVPKVNIPLLVPEAEEDQTIMGSKHDATTTTTLSSSLSSTGKGSTSNASSSKLTIVLPFPYYRDYSTMQLQIYKNLLSQSRNALLYGFDPFLCYLRTLRYQFGHYANFFINVSRPEYIGIQWRPGAFKLPSLTNKHENHKKGMEKIDTSMTSSSAKGQRKGLHMNNGNITLALSSPIPTPSLQFSQITIEISPDTCMNTNNNMKSSSLSSSATMDTATNETGALSTVFLSRILPLIESMNESGAGLVKQTKLQKEKMNNGVNSSSKGIKK